MKINPGFFKELLQSLVDDFYTDNEGRIKLWNGFRLLACDGSTLSLPSTDELLKIYGFRANQSGADYSRCWYFHPFFTTKLL